MKKHDSLLGTTFVVSLLIIFGKIIGFGREALIASYYGATAETDAFFFAQSMPSMFFPSVCNSISTAFVSLYVSKLAGDKQNDADIYASRMLLATTILSIVLSALGVVFAPVIVPLFAPGFAGAQKILAIHLTRLTMSAFVLTMLQYMLSAVLNSKRLFIGAQISGLLYNIVIIVFTVLLGRGQSMDCLTLVVILGHIVQTAALAFCLRGHFHLTPRTNPFHHETLRLLQLSAPILLGNAAIQINTIVDKALSSTLPEGSLSALSYANTLTFLVTSVFITSLSTVLYPTLTADAVSGNLEQYGKTLLQSLYGLECLLVPISCITLLTAQDIVDIVYARGSFNQTAVSYTATALACYAPMFIGSGIREVLNRAFYALGDTRTPMHNTAVGVFFNVAFSLLFVQWLGIAGIALGTTLSSLITAVLLFRSLRQKMPEVPLPDFLRHLAIQLLGGVALIIVLLIFRRFWNPPYAILRFLFGALIGFFTYFAVLFLLDGNVFRGPLRRLLHRFRI